MPRTTFATFLAILAGAGLLGCGSDEPPATPAAPADAGPEPVTLYPGEQCETPQPAFVRVRFEPGVAFLQPGQTRTLHVAVDPDLCEPDTLVFVSSEPGRVEAPAPVTFDLRHARIAVQVHAPDTATPGDATITASLRLSDGTDAVAELPVHVLDDALPPCSGQTGGHLAAGTTIKGSQGLTGASISLQAGADAPNSGAMYWHVDAFDATVGCGSTMTVEGHVALGPAITFGPANKRLPREIPFTIPINPARIPMAARLRHVHVVYSGPGAVTPRLVPIADPAIIQVDGVWAFSFKAPRLGTYQVVAENDGGTRTFKRRLTHRAVVGVSMGGGGSASFGTRFHELFDVVGPLGGPSDWTYLLSSIERYQLAGFPPNDGDHVPSTEVPMPEPQWPYEHPQTFNRWWYEFPNVGTGGGFDREEYVQLMRDLAYMYGNPFGQSSDPDAPSLPAGVPSDSPAVVGDHPGHECLVYVKPYDGAPDKEKLNELWNACPVERCAHTEVLQNYFDDEFNPKGSWPVITFCDGSPQNDALSPWSNTWTPDGNNRPVEIGLAVDYNGNGVRDENEPVIRSGHEPYRDVGTDGLASTEEPGYEPGVQEDPAGDDYDYQYNPTGLEGNGRYDEGEPFDDVGLDGVPSTAQSPYDVGEGDGKFTMSDGLRTFLERDARAVFRQQSPNVPSGPMTDAALQRLDFWADGGTRDLFNFLVAGNHFTGGLAARGRGLAYFTDFTNLPGQIAGDTMHFVPGAMLWEDIPGVVMQRYGAIDPSPKQVANGAGQHVGTPDEITRRLQTALYFVGSRWPDAPRWWAADSQASPVEGAEYCEIVGNCTVSFTDSLGRTGPVQISLPPGYAHADQQNVRYPVIYLLHGYGQTPEDLGAAIVFLRNWMNSPADSSASRLPKAIIVYVDGRCRVGPDGEAECIRGTFYSESNRPHGAKMETWWRELIDYIDAHYRTMGPSDIDWTE